jgi:signal transduction histidine kinase
MRLRTRVLVLLAVLAPALALCLLGLRSLRADAVESRRQAADRAHRLRDDLQLDLERALADVQGLVEAGDLPDLAFRIDGAGRILDPATRSFPATARSFAPGDLVALRGFLEKADRAIYRLDDPEGAIALLAPAEGLFEDEDLAAVLRERTALAYEKAGQLEEAARLYLEILDEHPGARDLRGRPLAVPAALRTIALLGELGREEEALTQARRFAALLAENAWGLDAQERALLSRDLPSVPAEVHYAALRGLVLPELSTLPADTGWTTLRGRAAGRSVLVTYRGRPGGEVEGSVLLEDELRDRVADRAARLAALAGAEAALDDGRPRPGAEVVRGPLASPFEGIAVVVAVRPDRREVVLALVWGGLSVLLLGGLAAGVLLGLRAMGREIRLARMRQELLDNVSHELRTPLASIRALAENLEDGAVPDARRPEYFSALSRESQRVTRLVEDVLDLSRLDRGDGLARRSAIEPAGLAREAVGALAHADGAGDYEVRLEVDDELPELRGDRDALRRALLNLLVNAARYSARVREGELEVRRRGRNVAWTVRDRGPGIPAEEHEAIFLRFHRVSSETHEVKGTGLGLPLARAIVEAHGGSLTVESEPGRGSAFTITLPVEEER